jgi:2,4-dienoyl-CoA reductase-like NADH-dependent reductase (Old Yellow Enzyme family)
MTHLFSPLTIKDITLRNRIGVSPMCQYSYTDGFSNDWQLVHLGARAVGGAGLIIAEATAVEARGRITPNDVGIWTDEQIEPLARMTKFVKSQGSVPGIQIAHAGRKASTMRPWDGGKPIPEGDARGWQVVGPSPLAFNDGFPVPQPLTIAEIQEIQQKFVQASQRALEAGFEWLEIHAAHGYLLHEFYSPLSNHRKDEYGGSFENRIRFLVETVQAVRKVWPDRLPLTARISGTDWVEAGWDVAESVELAKRLKQEGLDLIDCSSAGNVPHAEIPVKPGYQVPIAEARQADEIIRSGKADVVLLGRESLRDPNWPIRAAKDLGQPLPVPPQYIRAF